MAGGTPSKARTPLPKRQLAALVLTNMTAGFQMNVIFPFVPFMVEELRGTDVENGLWVGVLAASYFAGLFIASFIWPPLSDTLGRKKMLLLGMFGLTVPFVGFGLARSYKMAVCFRFLNGLLQQNWVITNAMLADITDSTNQALGASASSFSWGMAGIIAPGMGALLARPAINFPEYFDADGVFGRFPYLLPTLAVLAWGLVATVMGVLWLPADKLTWRQAGAKFCGRRQRYSALSAEDEAGVRESAVAPESEWASYVRIMRTRDTRLSILSRTLIPMTWVTLNELTPLFCKLPLARGGLGWSPPQIGLIISIAAVAQMVWQPIFFPPLTRWLGVVNSHLAGAITFTACIFLLPLVGLLGRHPYALWPVFSLYKLVEMAAGASTVGSIVILLMNAAEPGEQGRVQGLAGGIASLLMTIGPSIGGAIWSLTFDNAPGVGWPLPHLPFCFVGSLGLIMVYLGFQLPRGLELPKSERLATRASAGST
jgi:MFS family permease